jgi:nicotinamide riboside kinase
MTPQLICLLGAEGTGKTTLAKALAAHLGGVYSADVMAGFWQAHGRLPETLDHAALMRLQFGLEEQALAQARHAVCQHVLCDGAPLLFAVQSSALFADPSLLECAGVVHQRFALTLLLQPDIPCAPDRASTRGDAARQRVHQGLTHALQVFHLPHIEVSGTGQRRLQAAVEAIDALTS